MKSINPKTTLRSLSKAKKAALAGTKIKGRKCFKRSILTVKLSTLVLPLKSMASIKSVNPLKKEN